MSGKIIAIGTALPEYAFEQHEILAFMEQAHSDKNDFRKLKVLAHMSGIKKRYSVLPDFGMISNPTFFPHGKKQPDVEDRMTKYKGHGIKLAVDSIHNALSQVNVSLDEITHLITVTCTGLHAPGLNTELIKHLNLRADLFHSAVNFLGCNAAFYALKIADLIVRDNPGARVMVVCVELCTLHFQPKGKTDNLLSNTIFGDGAAAALVTGSETAIPGLKLNGFYSLLLHKGWDLMGWNVNPLSFEMVLDVQIPSFIGDEVEEIVKKASLYYAIEKDAITRWAIHPGGKKILDNVKERLQLNSTETSCSYDVLSEYGNMSSPTILFVLKKMLYTQGAEGEKILAIGFGPGLSIETALLSYVR